MKKEETEKSLFEKGDEYIERKTEFTKMIISALITTLGASITMLVEFIPNFKSDDFDKNKMLLVFASVAIAIFLGLVCVQAYLTYKKKNEKIEKFKTNLTNKYLDAIEQSFINPKKA